MLTSNVNKHATCVVDRIRCKVQDTAVQDRKGRVGDMHGGYVQRDVHMSGMATCTPCKAERAATGPCYYGG